MKKLIVAVVMMALPLMAQTEVKPIMYQDCGPLPNELSFQEKPMGYEPGFKVFLFISGSDMVSIDEKSLELDYMKLPEGRDISRTRSGKPAYEIGSFPKVSEDGKSAIFSIESKETIFGNAGRLNIKGKVAVSCGSKLGSVTSPELDVAKSESQKAGEYTVSVNEKSGDVMGSMFGSSDGLNVTVKGQLDKISDITFTIDGQKQETHGSTWTQSSKTYTLNKVTKGKLVVKITYWIDLVKKDVSFDINPNRAKSGQ